MPFMSWRMNWIKYVQVGIAGWLVCPSPLITTTCGMPESQENCSSIFFLLARRNWIYIVVPHNCCEMLFVCRLMSASAAWPHNPRTKTTHNFANYFALYYESRLSGWRARKTLSLSLSLISIAVFAAHENKAQPSANHIITLKAIILKIEKHTQNGEKHLFV